MISSPPTCDGSRLTEEALILADDTKPLSPPQASGAAARASDAPAA